MAFNLMRDGYRLKITSDTVGSVDAEGEAQLVFIEGSELTELPLIGDKLLNPEAYCGVGTPVEYKNITLRDITQVPYGYDHSGGDNEFKYELSYSSEGTVVTDFSNFQSDLDVISMDRPSYWRWGEELLPGGIDLPTEATNITGSVERKLNRVVVSGSFVMTKAVHTDNIRTFWLNYKEVAGKLNLEDVYVYGDSPSNSFSFARGQVLASGISEGKSNSGLFSFSITFKYKIINQKNAAGVEIESDDWNTALTAVGADGGGFLIPVKIDKSDTSGTALATDPYLYQYAATDAYDTLIFADYSNPEV